MPLAIDPRINMWEGKWDLRQLEGLRSAPAPYPAYQNALPIVGGIRSPWTLPLPDPFSFSPSGCLGPSFSGVGFDSWESLGENAGEWNEPRYVQPRPERPRIRGQDLRFQESENVFGTATPNHEIPSAGSAHPTRSSDVSRSLCTVTAGTAGKASSFKSSTSLRDDPGLSGQRLKRVLHVKQAPIYKYSLWTSHWIEQGGRKSGDPMTPRSELTKSEFDIQYGAWRKALVEGPPRKA